MRYLVLGGCGSVGSATVRDLVSTADFEQITVVDLASDRVAADVAQHGDKRVKGVAADVTRHNELAPLLERHDLLVNCTPGDDNVAILQAAIDAGVRYMDITGSMLAEERMALDGAARKAGVLAVIATGCSPGLTNAAAAYGVQQLDRTREITIEYASLRPMNPSVGLLDTALRQYTPYVKCPIFEGGKLRYEPSFSGARQVSFPPPIGEQLLYYTPHSEVVTLSKYVPGVETVKVYGTYHPSVMAALRVFRDHGLMETKEVEYEGRKISPRGFLTELLKGRDIPFPGPTHYCLRITVRGEKDGVDVSHICTMTYDENGPRAGQLPQIWMTAVGASVGAQILARTKTDRAGVMAPEACIDPGAYLRGAAARDFLIDWETHSSRPIRGDA